MTFHTIKAAGAAVMFTLLAPDAAAHEYSALIKAWKFDQAEHAANVRLSVDRTNADALIAKTDVILALAPESRLDEAVTLAEQCIAAHPQRSECHEALGNVLGTKAMMGGFMAAIGYVGKIRDAFLKAIELDPDNIGARHALMTYYTQAPRVVGGSIDKAEALIADTAGINAGAAKLMQASLDMSGERYARAEAVALAVNTAGSEQLGELQRYVLGGIATAYAIDEKFTESERVFREFDRRFPDDPTGVYGIGRTLQERGRIADAVAYFEKALAIHPRAHIYYRIGQCRQAAGDKARAIASFDKALSFKPALAAKLRSDAESRLKSLRD
jgi:tetratricopeptide (TPR) repeat protein